jgi:hypothetical protein
VADSLLFGAASRIAIAFLEYELIDDIFDHQKQTVDPEDIDNDIVFIVQSKAKQRPSKENNILHIVEKEYPYSVDLFEYLTHLITYA